MFNDNSIGATPLTEEDMQGLLLDTVFDRKTLNQVEAENIIKAKTYFMSNKKKYSNLDYLLSDGCVKDVHRRMFDEVWSWAGVYRKSDRNIGVPWQQISVKTYDLMRNYREKCLYISNSEEDIDILALSLHFDLVNIHPFPNGNGRQTRQMADLFLTAFGRPAFTWKKKSLTGNNSVRTEYINALRHAHEYDTQGDLIPLLAIARG